MKKERSQLKDASEVFMEKNVKGYKELGENKDKMSRKQPPKRKTLRLNTDDTFSKYPNAYASEAASPSVKAKHQDAQMNVESNKKSLKKNARSRGLVQSEYKGKK